MKNFIVPENIRAISDRMLPQMLQDRHYLHQHPELSFQEENTSKYIRDQLTALGIGFTLYDNRGIVAHIQGALPGVKVGALRADFDALPIQEQNDLPYKSLHDGVMHACGHDVHTAALLGVARILQELKPHFGGIVKLIFQPAEEKYPGGARYMAEAGALKNPDADFVIAQHVMPEMEAGRIGFKPGKYAAANDEINIIVKGRGGHGAQPQTAVDPTVIAAQILLSLQMLVSRVADPSEPTVLSFGRIIAEGANNIIPETVLMSGTLRTLDKEWRSQAHERIRQIAGGIATAMGASCEVEIQGFPNVENDAALTEELQYWAAEFAGGEQLSILNHWMAGEDFGEFARDIPGCYYRMGAGNKQKGIDAALHHPKFDIDEEPFFRISSALMSYLVLKKLAN